MMSLNRVFVSGNLLRDPELRRLNTGVAVCNIGVAVTERFDKQDGTKGERTVFLDVSVWEQQGEWCGENLRKGDRVAVEGSLQQDNWTDDQGQKRSKIKVRADRVHFLAHPSRRKEDAAPSAESTPEAAPPAAAPARPARGQGQPPPARRAPIPADQEA